MKECIFCNIVKTGDNNNEKEKNVILYEDDLLLITADHGNDPTFSGTDHTREYVPLLAFSKRMKEQGALPQGFYSDIAATIAENFGVPATENGKSFLSLLK